MSHAEHQFWEAVAGQANPQWKVRLDKDWLQNNKLSDIRAYCYVVDTQADWMCSGGLSANDLKKAERLYKDVPIHKKNDFMGAMKLGIVELANANAQYDDPAVAEVTGMAMASMFGTRTIKLARQAHPGLEGHWILILYRQRDGGLMTRPVYLSPATAGIASLTPDLLRSCVRQAIQADMTPGTEVHKMIRLGGGVNIAEALRV